MARGNGAEGKKKKDAISKKTAAKIEKLAQAVLKAVEKGKNPFLDIPVRSLANASWSEKTRLIQLGGQKQKRYFFNVSMARKFMQTFLVSEACKDLSQMGVAIAPGSMIDTLMPQGDSSRRRASVRASNACFEAE